MCSNRPIKRATRSDLGSEVVRKPKGPRTRAGRYSSAASSDHRAVGLEKQILREMDSGSSTAAFEATCNGRHCTRLIL